MTYFQNLGDVLTLSLQNVGLGVIQFIPNLIGAIISLGVGCLLAVLLERLVEHVFKFLKVDDLLKSAGLGDIIERAGHKLNSGLFIGALVKWFIIVVFLIASFDMLGLAQVTQFLKEVVNYLPQVIVAVLILMVAVVIANAMQKIVMASSRAANVKSAELLGRITKWSIWIFALLTALFNLGVAPGLIQSVVTAIFAGGALAVGLAFGLGGKEEAQKLIEKTAKALGEKD